MSLRLAPQCHAFTSYIRIKAGDEAEIAWFYSCTCLLRQTFVGASLSVPYTRVINCNLMVCLVAYLCSLIAT